VARPHAVARAGLKVLLEMHDGWTVAAEASGGKGAVSKAVETAPEVATLSRKIN